MDHFMIVKQYCKPWLMNRSKTDLFIVTAEKQIVVLKPIKNAMGRTKKGSNKNKARHQLKVGEMKEY